LAIAHSGFNRLARLQLVWLARSYATIKLEAVHSPGKAGTLREKCDVQGLQILS